MNTIDLVVLFLDLCAVTALLLKGIPAIRKEKMAKEKYEVAKAFAAFANTARRLHHEDGIEANRLAGWYASRNEADKRYNSQVNTLESRRQVSANGILVGKRPLSAVSY
jgi:hypothetical protein